MFCDTVIDRQPVYWLRRKLPTRTVPPPSRQRKPAPWANIRQILTFVEPLFEFLHQKGKSTAFLLKELWKRIQNMIRHRSGITETTRVYLQTDTGYEAVDPNRLTVGMKVEVLFTGIIMESYPVQAEADEILIIP